MLMHKIIFVKDIRICKIRKPMGIFCITQGTQAGAL